MTDTQTTNQNKGADLAGFAAMFEATQAATPNGQIGGEGEIVSGLVVQVNRDSVVVDIGGKSEGVISKSEFVDAVGAFNVKAGELALSFEKTNWILYEFKWDNASAAAAA